MIDYARITVKAGDGGDGAGSFRHIKGKRRGKADGGSGGNGGNVYLQATYDLNTLEPYRFIKDYFAKNGQRGTPNLRKGAIGEDLVLKVPVGTEVQLSVLSSQLSEKGLSVDQLTGQPKTGKPDTENRKQKTDNRFTYDLVEDGQRVLVARGGAGGRGNAYLRDEYGRRPKTGERGGVGEVCQITLELKLIADVGLIGLPNSGKSTLLAALTAAKPQIAPYPFTTLEPNLGVLEKSIKSIKSTRGTKSLEQEHVKETLDTLGTRDTRGTRLTLADIPGLIEGASKGKGLGDLFLRHIERTRLLLHLIDVSKVPEVPEVSKVSKGRLSAVKLWDDYQTIRNELKNYSKELTKKREVIVLTKSDLVLREAARSAVELFKAKKKRVVLISAVTKDGLAILAEMLFRIKKS